MKPSAKYPPTLITTADQHDRVFPGHSFKFAAALQAAQAGLAPILIRTETRTRHGAGQTDGEIIEDQTDQWWFLHSGVAFHRNVLQLLTSVALADRISESNVA